MKERKQKKVKRIQTEHNHEVIEERLEHKRLKIRINKIKEKKSYKKTTMRGREKKEKRRQKPLGDVKMQKSDSQRAENNILKR